MKPKIKKPTGMLTTSTGKMPKESFKNHKVTNQKGAFGQKSIFPRSDARISNRMKTAIYREELRNENNRSKCQL